MLNVLSVQTKFRTDNDCVCWSTYPALIASGTPVAVAAGRLTYPGCPEALSPADSDRPSELGLRPEE